MLALILLLAASCGETGNTTHPRSCPEDELIRRIYDGPKWPTDVQVDPQAADVSYLGFNGSTGRDFPCVASVAEAESLATLAGFAIAEGHRETDLYFEFDNESQFYGRPIVRVYRSSYLQSLTLTGLVGVDWPSGGIGRIGPVLHRPLTAETVLRLFDQVWIQWNYHLSGAVLLSRQVSESDDTFVLATHEALIIGGDWGVCDRVDQLITMYTVQKMTGEVSIARFTLPEKTGRCFYWT